MRRSFVIWVVTMAFAGGVLASEAETEAVWRQYVIAKNRLAYELYELYSRRWPDLSGTLSLQRDQQLASIAIRDLKFRHLLENDPSRVTVDNGLVALATFEWTEADTKALREAHPEFAQLESFAARIARDMAADPNMNELSRRMIDLQNDPDYQLILSRFNAHAKVLESSLAAPLPID